MNAKSWSQIMYEQDVQTKSEFPLINDVPPFPVVNLCYKKEKVKSKQANKQGRNWVIHQERLGEWDYTRIVWVGWKQTW